MKQVLIIDDDIYIGNVIEEALIKEGYQVLRAYSGTEAIYVLSASTPDLILLDLMLPGLSGEEVGQHGANLTRTEYAILKILMQNPSQVIAKSVLLERISEDTPDCTDNSLKTHISHLRKKLRDIGGKEYIDAVWGIGFKLKSE